VLPSEDQEFLLKSGWDYELIQEGSQQRVVIDNYPLPSGYTVEKTSLMLKLGPNYPDDQIDMAFFFPAVLRSDNKAIIRAVQDNFDAKVWQGWSRHRTSANPWRPGLDNIEMHLILVNHWLTVELTR